MADGFRTFVAFETPADVREVLSSVQKFLSTSIGNVRWESPDKFHCTIKFLGNIPASRISAILDIIGNSISPFPRFPVIYDQVGAFPTVHRPRVLWAGCRNDDRTRDRIKTALDESLVPEGFPVEDRAFHPHVTLGRLRIGIRAANLTPMLENLTFEPQIIQVGKIVVMKSDLRPQGALYSVLKEIQLR
jgi:2'-5' RNA ligase